MAKTAEETKRNYLNHAEQLGGKCLPEVIIMLDLADDVGEENGASCMSLDLHGNKRNVQNEMYRDRISDEAVSLLVKPLMDHNIFIVGLNLGYNLITGEGAAVIGKYLEVTNALKTLILSYNDIDAAGAAAIAKGLQMNDSLTELRLDGNKFGNEGGMAIAGALQVNDTLSILNMDDTDLTAQTLVAFTTVLKTHRSLLNIHLGRPLLKSLQEETTVHIGKMLETNNCLQEIHITKHGMCNSGAQQLMKFISDNMYLLHLDLSCNSISRDGIKAIAEYLGRSPQLEVLNLGYNRAEDDGAIDIAEALRSNMNLKTLVLCSNSLSDFGLCALAKVLKNTTALQQLFIWGNKFGNDASQAFMDLTVGEVPRLAPEDTDVRAYVVDGVPCLARLASPY